MRKKLWKLHREQNEQVKQLNKPNLNQINLTTSNKT